MYDLLLPSFSRNDVALLGDRDLALQIVDEFAQGYITIELVNDLFSLAHLERSLALELCPLDPVRRSRPVGCRDRENKIVFSGMALSLTSGFRRLFAVFTAVWIVLCVVVLPLCIQWDHQRQALDQFHIDNKMCDGLIVERPEWQYTKDCYTRSMDRFQTTLNAYSFSTFWLLPVDFWRLFVPLALIPPAMVGILGLSGVWTGRGFKRTS